MPTRVKAPPTSGPGANLRMVRALRNVTQAQLAKAIGVGSRTLIRWENGDAETWTTHQLEAAADYCDVPHWIVIEGPNRAEGEDHG